MRPYEVEIFRAFHLKKNYQIMKSWYCKLSKLKSPLVFKKKKVTFSNKKTLANQLLQTTIAALNFLGNFQKEKS